MSSYLVYICQAVKDRAGLERYWQEAPAVYPQNIDVLVAYGPSEVLDADLDEHVEGVVIAEFPPFERTVEWFNGDAYVRARKNREATNISAWSWRVELRRSASAVPARLLLMSSSFAVKFWIRRRSIRIGSV